MILGYRLYAILNLSDGEEFPRVSLRLVLQSFAESTITSFWQSTSATYVLHLLVEFMNEDVVWDAAHRLFPCLHKMVTPLGGQRVRGTSQLLELDIMFFKIS